MIITRSAFDCPFLKMCFGLILHNNHIFLSKCFRFWGFPRFVINSLKKLCSQNVELFMPMPFEFFNYSMAALGNGFVGSISNTFSSILASMS